MSSDRLTQIMTRLTELAEDARGSQDYHAWLAEHGAEQHALITEKKQLVRKIEAERVQAERAESAPAQ